MIALENWDGSNLQCSRSCRQFDLERKSAELEAQVVCNSGAITSAIKNSSNGNPGAHNTDKGIIVPFSSGRRIVKRRWRSLASHGITMIEHTKRTWSDLPWGRHSAQTCKLHFDSLKSYVPSMLSSQVVHFFWKWSVGALEILSCVLCLLGKT